MRTPINLFLVLFLSFASALSFSYGQTIDIGTVERSGEGKLAVAVESPDATMAAIARKAFGLHGGYVVVPADKAAFVFRFEPAASGVSLSIRSGRPAREQLRRTVSGATTQDALLRACDMAVQATLSIPGFFSGKFAFVGKKSGATELYTSDLLFSSVRRLTSDGALLVGPDWSPDGRQILYTTYHRSGFPDIFKIDLSSGRRTPIATFKGTNTGGTFSPDGRRIAMVMSGTGNSEVYVADANGRSIKRLTRNRSLEASPSWSPDGRRIVFASDAPGKPQLFEVSSTGGPSRLIRTNISNYCSEPVWNPVHANLIAFTVAVGRGFQIALYDASTGKSEILTSVRDDAVEPAWLNDGRHIVFTRRSAGRKSLMLLDTETSTVRSLHSAKLGEASSASFVY